MQQSAFSAAGRPDNRDHLAFEHGKFNRSQNDLLSLARAENFAKLARFNHRISLTGGRCESFCGRICLPFGGSVIVTLCRLWNHACSSLLRTKTFIRSEPPRNSTQKLPVLR